MVNQRQYFSPLTSQAFDPSFLRAEEALVNRRVGDAIRILKDSSASLPLAKRRLSQIVRIIRQSRSHSFRGIAIGWVDWYPHWNPTSNFITDLLDLTRIPYYVVGDSHDADILFAGVYGDNFVADWQNTYAFSVLCSGENVRPTFGIYDFSLSTDLYEYSGKNHRWPEYYSQLAFSSDGTFRSSADETSLRLLYREKQDRDILFSAVYNNSCPHREHFISLLSQRYGAANVKTYGSTRIGRDCDKYEILGRSRFHLAFENSTFPGYTTEKLFQCLQMGAYGLYWGPTSVETEFDSRYYANIEHYHSSDDLFKHIECIYEDFNQMKVDDALDLKFLKTKPERESSCVFLAKLMKAIRAIYVDFSLS